VLGENQAVLLLISFAEVMVHDLQHTVLVRRRKYTTVEKDILLLIVCGQMYTLLHDSSSSVMLQVEQVLHILGLRSHAGVEVRSLKVRHVLNALLHMGFSLFRIGKSTIGIAVVAARQLSHKEVSVK
jgi:hypothetical protein